ncbi:MAG TPA: DUF192 domain-containing protein [Steroidobacteraceae bacterium]
MKLRAQLLAFVSALLPLFSLAARADSQAPLDLTTFPQSSVEITSGAKPQRFSVWIADTAERQTQGLMFVRDLPAERGMLFLQSEPRPMAFWMKNTYIELDMLFIGPDHRIVKIAAHAPPLSLATINSDAPVIAVLELKGGEAERRGFRVHDRVSWPKT